MPINPEDVRQRWQTIRGKESLALDPESVSDYLKKRESDIVRERIHETLSQLALYRCAESSFHSDKPVDSKGDLATCEGLETFLIPAVEGALSFSSFLEDFKAPPDVKEKFIAALTADINELLDSWLKGKFSGKPYSDDSRIIRSLMPTLKKTEINITETAAMACRVIIHLLTLKLNRPEERLFQEKLGKTLDDEKLFTALKNAIEFLIRAFQKNGEGETLEAKIAGATVEEKIGSGWSWTDWDGLPPMLFFTASAVDAFAELDLYLIRPAESGALDNGDAGQRRLLAFYNNNKSNLLNLQLCVEMARLWVQKSVLPYLSKDYGLYKGDLKYDFDFDKDAKDAKPEWYELYEKELLTKVSKFQPPPLALYNNLYSLQILLWSWGDWNDDGSDYDEEAKSNINRALAQLVYNYDSLHIVKEILTNHALKFYLPGRKYFETKSDNTCEYLDAGFLPLLTRLLVLFVVYGVGDRNLLEPVIRDLYIELLQNRNRTLDYSAMWSVDLIEIFSTQRAIQALTFYFAYARGKEQATVSTSSSDGVIWRNKTGTPLILEVVREGRAQIPVPETVQVQAHEPPPIMTEHFTDYCKELSGWQPPPQQAFDAEGVPEFLDEIDQVGDSLLADLRGGQITNGPAAKLILNALARISSKPIVNQTLRKSDLELLKEQHKELSQNGRA